MPETLRQGFGALNLPPAILAKLDRAGFVTPTPIQEQAIPIALEGSDLIGIAQTGTGKTLAFGLPIVATLGNKGFALILAPTRELAAQIEEIFHCLGSRTALLIGGEGLGRQRSQLRGRPTIIVATPGRLEDHLAQGNLRLDDAAIVVLDEADRMLDMGFAPAIHRILRQTRPNKQTMLFSATMPKQIVALASTFLRDPKRIDVGRAGEAAEGVDQEVLMLMNEDKSDTLRELLIEHPGTVLVFTRTRHGARKTARAVRSFGHSVAELHADRTLAQRRAALDGFKSGEHRVLVATDIAARGIDVKDITLVINYDVPEKPEDYIHRIGRTGRAGARGRAIMLATPEQKSDIRDIEHLLRTELPISPRSRVRLERAPAPHPAPTGRFGPKRNQRGRPMPPQGRRPR